MLQLGRDPHHRSWCVGSHGHLVETKRLRINISNQGVGTDLPAASVPQGNICVPPSLQASTSLENLAEQELMHRYFYSPFQVHTLVRCFPQSCSLPAWPKGWQHHSPVPAPSLPSIAPAFAGIVPPRKGSVCNRSA